MALPLDCRASHLRPSRTHEHGIEFLFSSDPGKLAKRALWILGFQESNARAHGQVRFWYRSCGNAHTFSKVWLATNVTFYY